MKKATKAAKLARQNIIHPAVKFLEAHIPPGRISEVARKAGLVSGSMRNWFDGTNIPTIYLIDHALHALGYKLAVVPLSPLALPPGTISDENES